ncbi:unnamed protein product, partial [Ectocarpus sp. 6 AP-2014]
MARRDVLCEIQSVLDALRRNARFEIREHRSAAEESRLTADLKALREAVRDWPNEDLRGLSRLELVSPFLSVVRSPETNGVLTEAALRSLQVFSRDRLIEENSVHASEAVGDLVDALIGCRFEETQQDHDEAVRARIMHVLAACLEGGAGVWLSDEVVWAVLQTCMANLDQMQQQQQQRQEQREWAVEPPTTAAAPVAAAAAGQKERGVAPAEASSSSSPSSSSQPQRRRAGVAGGSGGSGGGGCGLPCVVKVFGFLCSQLVRRGGGGGAGASGTASGVSSRGGGASGGPTPRRILCLRLMRTALAAAGGNLAAYPSLLEMVRDDLCFALLHLMQGSGGVNVVGEVLSIVRYLWGSLRVHLKVQLELLFGATFLRALSQLKEEGEDDLRQAQEEQAAGGAAGGAAAAAAGPGQQQQPQPREQSSREAAAGSSGVGAAAARGGRVFRDRELEMALECLCDFLAEPTFLVEMYINYDCDTQASFPLLWRPRSNLTEMLVAALADGAYAGPDRLSGARAACVAALTAALRRLHERCATAAAAAAAAAVTVSGGGGDCGGPRVVDGGPGDSEQGRIGGEGGGIGAAMGGEGGGLAASATDSGTLAESVLGTPPSALPAAEAAVTATAAAAAAAGITSDGRLPSPSRCREARRCKAALTRGARAFAKKPREGLKFLQREGLFRQQQQEQQQSSSLDAKEVAAFLRATPGLDKAAVGAYLGEAGAKRVNGRGGGGGGSIPEGTVAVAAVAEAVSPPSKEGGGGGRTPGGGSARGAVAAVYQGDTEEFHAEVLEAFVDTFDFRGQGILASLRMFLGAFRLPGEAQQIDRILHAFAQRVHRDCVEAARGMLASADVAYLLSFSVIMLNTDLHNPNIRPEKRMSCGGFVRNNENYGGDISGGRDLPADYLESVYTSIKEQPIATSGGGPDDAVTAHGWQDLLRRYGDMNTMAVFSSSNSSSSASGKVEACGGQGVGEEELEEYDRDVISACWPSVLKAASAAFATMQGRDASALGASVDLFLILAKLCGHHHGLQNAFDKVILLLCRFTGLVGPIRPPGWRTNSDSGSSHDNDDGDGDNSDPDAAEGVSAATGTGGVKRLMSGNPAARTAAVAAFGIAHRSGDHMREGWLPLLQLIFAMRDLHILPKEALSETGEDLLENRERAVFNAGVLSGDVCKTAATATATAAVTVTTEHRQGVGERNAAHHGRTTDVNPGSEGGEDRFGGGGNGGDRESTISWVVGRRPAGEERSRAVQSASAHTSAGAGAATLLGGGAETGTGLLDEAGGREGYGGDQQQQDGEEGVAHPAVELWNETFETFEKDELSDADGSGSGDGDAERQGADGAEDGGGEEAHKWFFEGPRSEGRDAREGGAADGHRRGPPYGLEWVAQARVQDLVGESRRLGADSLRALIHALIAVVHGSLPAHERRRRKGFDGGAGGGTGVGDCGTAAHREGSGGMAAAVATEAAEDGFHFRRRTTPRVSTASLAYAEVLIAEIALRNRERIVLVLPVLLEHYRRRLAGATYATFSVEKAATGLLRIVSRLFFRPGLAAPLSRALPWLIPPHCGGGGSGDGGGPGPELFCSLAGHVSSAMRRLALTATAGGGGEAGGGEVGGGEWRAVLSVVEACAGVSGGRGEADTFEAVCLLVHNQDLKEILPVQGVAACLSTLILCGRRQSTEKDYTSTGRGNGSGKHARMFAGAALDLLMVLH